MDYLQVFINAIVVALMTMYVYENQRKIEKMSTRLHLTEKEFALLKIVSKSKEDQIKELKQLLSTKAETEKLAQIENQQIAGTKKLTEVENQLNAGTRKQSELENQQITGTRKLTELENQQIAGTRKLTEIDSQQIAGTRKLTEVENQLHAGTRKQAELESQQNTETKKMAKVENQLLKSNEKGVTYIRWGKTKCAGPTTETIYSGQVGGAHYSYSGASVNYICLPENPDVAQPLKSHDSYGFLYGAEYEVFDYNKPQGIRSGIGQQDVACAACLAKEKISSIMIPGRKTCYNGWTKEYEGFVMSGHHSHAAASEFACVDRDAEAIAGGSNDENGILFYPVKTQCGSLKCPPYIQDTEVLCVVCSK